MNEIVASVILATYRRDFEFKIALQSICEQSYKNVEIIVVDDNADNNWNEIISRIVEDVQSGTSRSITLIQNAVNSGSAGTRNIGIRAVTGEYVTFLDDDDVYTPEKIAHQVASMKDAQADYGITDLRLLNKKGQLVEYRKRSYLVGAHQEEYLALHLIHHMSGTDTLMFKREYLLKIGGFPAIDLGDEFYLMLCAILAGGKLCYLPECGVNALVHEGESGLSSGKSKLKCENDLYEEKKKYFGQLNGKTIRAIKMRHYAVLSFAEVRMGRKVQFLSYGIRSFVSSPLACFKLLKERKQ